MLRSPWAVRIWKRAIRCRNWWIAYHHGNDERREGDNVAVCASRHALTANSDVADWWPHTVRGDGRFSTRGISSSANIIGSALRHDRVSCWRQSRDGESRMGGIFRLVPSATSSRFLAYWLLADALGIGYRILQRWWAAPVGISGRGMGWPHGA